MNVSPSFVANKKLKSEKLLQVKNLIKVQMRLKGTNSIYLMMTETAKAFSVQRKGKMLGSRISYRWGYGQVAFCWFSKSLKMKVVCSENLKLTSG